MDKAALTEIGMVLRDARKEAGFSVEHVAKVLKIRRAYISALEKGDIKKLKFDAYTIGYIRHYAELLDVNPDGLLDRIKLSEMSVFPIDPDDLIITGREFLPSKAMIAVCALLLILIYIFVEFHMYLR